MIFHSSSILLLACDPHLHQELWTGCLVELFLGEEKNMEGGL